MNLVDSSGWVEYFVEGKHATDFVKPIEQVGKLIIPTIITYEVFKYFIREVDEHHAWDVVSAMCTGQIVELNLDISLQAAKLSLQLNLPMADSIILATAKTYKAVLWTLDKDFQGIDGVQFIGN
jgi:toxin FitB